MSWSTKTSTDVSYTQTHLIEPTRSGLVGRGKITKSYCMRSSRFVRGISACLGCPEWQITAFTLALPFCLFVFYTCMECLQAPTKAQVSLRPNCSSALASVKMPNLCSSTTEAGGSEEHWTAPCLSLYCKILLVLMNGLAENKAIPQFLFQNKVGENNKSSQNILVISHSFKTLHNSVKTGNLKIS